MPAKFVFNRANRRKAMYYPQRPNCDSDAGVIWSAGKYPYNISEGNAWFRSHEEWPFPPCASPQELHHGFYGPKVLYKW